MTILLCALAGAVVAGLAAHLLTAPERRAARQITLARMQAALAYLESRREAVPDECPMCVARHRPACQP